jgi:glycine dehydrogenase
MCIRDSNNVLKNAPHTIKTIAADDWPYPYTRQKAAFPLPYLQANKFWPACSRIDNAYGDRNLICTCKPIAELETEMA